jgi:hypothetical protein
MRFSGAPRFKAMRVVGDRGSPQTAAELNGRGAPGQERVSGSGFTVPGLTGPDDMINDPRPHSWSYQMIKARKPKAFRLKNGRQSTYRETSAAAVRGSIYKENRPEIGWSKT